MNSRTVISLLTLFLALVSCDSKPQHFIVLGDMHYDLIEDHDMEWLATKPGDLIQVTEGYTLYTAQNWEAFCDVLAARAIKTTPPVTAVIQLGDLSEGLAGNPEKAKQMASNTMKAVRESGIPAPWVITKGNHDITGPRAVEAFNEIYLPEFRSQLKDNSITSANYVYQSGDVAFVCFDPWEKSGDPIQILEENLRKIDAKYKFVSVHEPVIPVNERCWHLYRKDNEKREELLRVIAQNKAVVLCAHLHLYSVVKRDTQYGPIVQILVNSVIKDRSHTRPAQLITEYGPSLAINVPEWEPQSLEQRVAWLEAETPHVSYFKQMDLPGYGILSVDDKKDEVTFSFYPAFSDKPYDIISISDLTR
ncbi:MAG: metallophosphoesterase family protein [Bacteroidales bacterium]